jgi:hypothetical protein
LRIRLTRKLANALNGIDLRAMRVGEVVDLTDPLAQMLIAERWAEEIAPLGAKDTADDRPPRRARRASKKGPKPSRPK